MDEVFLVRHGQASFGSDDYDRLSDRGHEQSAWLGQWFTDHGIAFDRVITGTMRRHRETADGILSAAQAGDRDEDAGLNEIDYDALEEVFLAATGAARPTSGRAFRDMLPRLLDHWAADRLAPVPETFAGFRSRVDGALDRAARTGHRTLVVSSGGPVSATLARLLQLNTAAMAEVMNMTMNASVTRLGLIDGRLTLLQFNAVPHLEHPARRHARTFI